MKEKQTPDGWPESFHILPNPLTVVKKALGWFCTMHELSPVSEHFKHEETQWDQTNTTTSETL